MAGIAGALVGLTSGSQTPIGEYVQDTEAPSADTNYDGVNVEAVYDTNVLEEDYVAGWTCPTNQAAATGGVAQWVISASDLIPTDKVAIVAGVATLDNATGTHTVFATVAPDQFFWAVED
jgi:hypothetical protein